MKIVSHYFQDFAQSQVYPAFITVFFMTFFIVVTAWALKARKEYIDSMSQLPLDEED